MKKQLAKIEGHGVLRIVQDTSRERGQYGLYLHSMGKRKLLERTETFSEAMQAATKRVVVWEGVDKYLAENLSEN